MFGQIPDFTNGFELMSKLWGTGAGLPGSLMPGLQAAMTPPMNLEDLDKRIHDLKAVEGWLQLNTNLLHTTIQGLEVQRATLVALQTFGNALSPEAMQSAMENVARTANAPSASPPPRPAADEKPAQQAAPAEDAPAPGAQAEAASQAAESALPPNASLWWDMLQQQFNQIASGAAAASMAPFGMGGFAAHAPDASATAAKPAAKTATAGKTAGEPAPRNGAAAKSPAKGATKAAPKSTAARKKPADAAKAAKSNGAPGTPDGGEE
ncbi:MULTISPECIES: PhaM family polyhydroxyalkanoate granule multifunctional regulatory protein [Cupriavidus]|nr:MULTISPECIES: PhaM family polyhydroxyalkanoate granule multifunctional regulatory protein [Cupriavidus]QYY31739.1 hypothetical protein K2O51_12995 [Cupriavidus pinatubonensis]